MMKQQRTDFNRRAQGRFGLVKVLGSFARDERGSFSIEGVLWMPVFVLMLAGIIDFSMVYHEKANISQLVHKTNRAVSLRQHADAATATDALNAELQRYVQGATVTVTKSETEVETRVSVPAANIAAMGVVSLFSWTDINVAHTHLLEP